MPHALLLTLTSDGRAFTFAFDGSASALLQIGDCAGEDAARALARVEARKGTVTLAPAKDCALYGNAGEQIEQTSLADDEEAVFSIASPRLANPAALYVRPSTHGARSWRKLGFSFDAEVLIGRDENAGFRYESRFVSSRHAVLSLVGEEFFIQDAGSANGTYVNGTLVAPQAKRPLSTGDVVQVMDLSFVVGRRFISINQPRGFSIGAVAGAAPIDHRAFAQACPSASETDGAIALFYPAPRLSHSIHRQTFQIDSPPAAKKPDDQPALMQMGPSFLMGIASIFMVTSAVSRLANGADVITTLPMIAMSVSMIAGTVVWPVISKRYNKKRDAREELRRESTYTDYLNRMEAKFAEECEIQARILKANRVSSQDAITRALQLSPRLMNRSLLHDDFMDLRVGVGTAGLQADFRWPQQRFTVDSDALLDKVAALADNPPEMNDVPLAFNPVAHYVAGIVGERMRVWEFARGLIVQMCALYSYQDLKIVLFADEAESREWSFMRALPHLFDDAGETRFIATSTDGAMNLGMRLERALESRAEVRASSPADYGTYVVVICASKRLAERSETVTRLSKLRDNRGFSVLFFGEELKDLPRECGYVIDLSENGALDYARDSQGLGVRESGKTHERRQARRAHMFERGDVSGTDRPFDPDIAVSATDAQKFALALTRAHLDTPAQNAAMPASLGFLEMFEAGATAGLNIGQRWAEHDASRTLQTPLGRDAQGGYALLNLHENVHGPHGLIAGTTGSGKSELIITYILSLCVNYAPDQVSFVLIDYKGGGLAGAFDNERLRLPHLAGTITNLDGAAISRSLVSIKSELKRRQDMLNKARDITGEATVDIYKYLSYYRQGVLTEPLPHLFIIADEFAELKSQEPEFMTELISAARIGRSLGVHLILATQKPSGVVDDQIWSNSRFKVCLKVADAADSNEMIKRPDAAEIKGPGRFYQLVGYNESFTAGQAAYAGGAYAPTDTFEPKRDNAVELLDEAADAIAALRPPKRETAAKTSELNAVLAQIEEVARATGKSARRLWLDPVPAYIELSDLEKRYSFAAPEDGLACALAEVDDPARQRRLLYAVDFAEAGNVVLYGAQNSGVESLLSTMMFGLISHYDPDRLSVYAIDLGSGSLTAFSDAPQCGGVVLPGDDECMENLFKLIEGEIANRRKLFAKAGGIEAYNAAAAANGEEAAPRIVVALVNMASFNELYAGYEERLVAITRDAPRYGIHFVVTASAATIVRMRLKSNFGLSLVTAFNDQNDYVTVLGSMSGVVAPKQDKRGLIKLGKEIFEFQGASIAADAAATSAAIAQAGQAAASRTPARASRIPVLPERVHAADMGEAANDDSGPIVPVGFSKADVAPISFSLEKSPFMLVLGNDVDGIGRYLRGMREALGTSPHADRLFVDPEGVMGPLAAGDDVIGTIDDATAAIAEIVAGVRTPRILVFTSIAQTMANLPAAVSQQLQDYIAKERCAGSVGIVAASEMWRVKSLYQDWYKVLSAYGNGVWVGSGFADQTIFRFPRALPEYRLPAARSDGYYMLRGNVWSVRLIEMEDEPEDV